MDNNQNQNVQNNLETENLDDMSNQTPASNQAVQNVTPTAQNNVVGNSQNNFDPYTGQPINQNPVPNQAPVQPNMNTQVQPAAPKKGNGAFIAIVAVLAVIILGLVVFIAFGDKIKDALGGGNKPVPTENPGGGGNNVVNNTTVTISGYDFQVPQGFVFDKSSGPNMFIDRLNKVAFVPYVNTSVTYSELVSKSDSVKAILENKGVSVTNYAEKTFEGKNWLVYNYTSDEGASQYSFTALESNNVLEVDYYNLGNILSDEQVYSLLNKMISTATRNNGSSFSPSENQNPGAGNFSAKLFE